MKTFRHCLQRFPAATAFVTTLATLLVCLCWGLDDKLTERQIFVSTYYLSVGSILTLTLRLWGEEVKSRRRRLVVNALCHAALIAEPQHDPGQQRIDWYAGVNGTATPVSALPAEEAERLRARAGDPADL